jgi:hypothetical protein
MSTPITSIRNLGPAFESSCHSAGIKDAETLRALGAHEAYRKLLQAGTRPHFIGYYVIHMGLQGRPWNDCKGEEKKTLRTAFDQLCAEVVGDKTAAPTGIEKILNEIGVIKRK